MSDDDVRAELGLCAVAFREGDVAGAQIAIARALARKPRSRASLRALDRYRAWAGAPG